MHKNRDKRYDHDRPARPARRRGLVLAALAVLLGILAAACGGGETTTAGPEEGTATPDAQGGGTSETVLCPSLERMFDLQNRATYAVVLELPGSGDAGPRHATLGTAWAVGDGLLVTNAHVTEGVLELGGEGMGITRVLGVQSGTGEVVELVGAVSHPDWDGDALGSPDVGLFVTEDPLPTRLRLAFSDAVPAIGADIQIVGFPGDVNDEFMVVPGETVPQATSLTGQVTAIRSYSQDQQVDSTNIDIVQHQAPTTPGTSGSSIVLCDTVIGVNNAGTVRLVVVPGPDGGQTIDRQVQAANNFGVHARHIRGLIELFGDGGVTEVTLPPPVVTPTATPPPTPAPEPDPQPVVFVGGIGQDGAVHDLAITINPDGTIVGTSLWPETGEFTLTGTLSADGSVQFSDDAPERLGFRRGFYQGAVQPDGTLLGIYFEETAEDVVFDWTAAPA